MGQFKGNDRFAIQRRLGSGSFGVVYEAFDTERKTRVALKVPHEANALNIYLFKQEFRVLAEMAHPNLVTFLELIAHGQDWFFTMELVDGLNFYEHLRQDGGEVGAKAGRALPSLTSVFAHGSSGRGKAPIRAADEPSTFGAPEPPGPFERPPDYGMVRLLLRQLAEGLWALHQLGQLHGDIKPTNVLVAPGGRVVLLDFGLSMDLGSQRRDETPIRGTPAYMAPEQIGGQPPTEASDWYSVGVMLYQVLTGQVPFPGNNLSSVINKMRVDPPSPRTLLPETPGDLDSLCMALLTRKPELRPAGAEILAGLGASPTGAPMRSPTPVRLASSDLLLGREGELALLGQAYERSQQGRAVMVFVHGASGMGKSYLLRRFLRQLQQEEPRAVLLQGRCYEQESVPYKALDGLVDALSQYLHELPETRTASLLPRDLSSLVRLFPVLNRVPAVAASHAPGPTTPDPQELRFKAFGALRELLRRLGDRYPLVLTIDDLQWGDPDSASLLSSLCRAPNPPSMLVLASFHTEEGVPSQALADLQERLAEEGAEVLEIRLEDLPAAEARTLAMALLGADLPDAGKEADRIAEAAQGNPFFIDELSRHVRAGLAPEVGAQDLESYIRDRVAAFPPDCRSLLELLAVAGHPLEREVLHRACEVAAPDEALTLLRAGHLVRIRGSHRQLVEARHDRIGHSVRSGLDPERRRDLHARLAQALEAAPVQDARALTLHYEAAGEIGKAARYAVLAAELGVAAIAFGRAAVLYQKAMDLGAPQGRAQRDLLVKLGDAQALSGRGLEAARNYLLAIQGSTAFETLRLQRRASEEFFRCGHFEQGLATLKAVMANFGMALPENQRWAVLRSLWSRLRLRLRGYGFQERRESKVPQRDLDRIDTCWAAAMGLGPIDAIRGAEFQARHLLLALEAGEPFRLVRALAHETIFLATRGVDQLAATQQVQAITLALAERIGHPNPLGRALLAAGTAALMQGRWKASVDLLQRAETLLRENCTGLDFELHIAQNHALLAHLQLGNLREVERRLPHRIQTAREKGDLLAITNLQTSISPYLHLAQDDPARALREGQQALQGWSSSGYLVQHFHGLCAELNARLYLGDPDGAWAQLTSQMEPLRRSRLQRIQLVRIATLELRARCALALAMTADPDSRPGRAFFNLAHEDLLALEKEGTAYGEAFALKLQAMEALVLNRPEEASALFFQAEIAFQGCDMGLHAAVVRRFRGQLDGRPGADHIEAAEKWMQGQGILDPARYSAMLLPNMEAPQDMAPSELGPRSGPKSR